MRGDLINECDYLKGGVRAWMTLHGGAKQQDKRQWAKTDGQEVLSEYKEELLHDAGD